MADLARLYMELGFGDVRTYIQSGNVVFSDGGAEEDEVVRRLEAGLEARYGFAVGVMVRSAEEWGRVISDNPFPAAAGEEREGLKGLVVTFLSGEPSEELVDEARDVDAGEDEFAVVGRDVYVNCVGGYGMTGLTNGFFEKRLKVPGTTRNWRTVNRIGDLL